MGYPKKTNLKAKDSTHLNRSQLGPRGMKSAGRGRSWMRVLRVLLFGAAFGLAAVHSAAASPSLLQRDAVDGNTSGGNTLPEFSIKSGSNRILIVAVDDEEPAHVTSVMLGSVPMTYVGGQIAEPSGTGNATSLWVILDADLPADGDYDIVVSGGDKPSVAAMLWSGLAQEVPAGSAIAGTGQVGGNQITTSVVAPAADSLVVGTSGHGSGDGWAAAPAGWTRQWDVDPNSASHAGATSIAADSGLISLTSTCDDANFNRVAQFVAAFAPASALDPAPGCPGCRYRRSITIAPAKLGDSCAADVARFPVLVTIKSSTNQDAATKLRSVVNSSHVQNSSN